MIEGLLAKPSTKPNFSMASIQGNSALDRVRSFLPEFITSTDRLLSTGVGANAMDV